MALSAKVAVPLVAALALLLCGGVAVWQTPTASASVWQAHFGLPALALGMHAGTATTTNAAALPARRRMYEEESSTGEESSAPEESSGAGEESSSAGEESSGSSGEESSGAGEESSGAAEGIMRRSASRRLLTAQAKGA